MQVILTNTTTNYRQYYDNVEVNNDNPLYVIITIDTNDLNDGEYLMSIYKNDNSIIAEELIRIGNHKNNKIEYKVEKKYIQYGKK